MIVSINLAFLCEYYIRNVQTRPFKLTVGLVLQPNSSKPANENTRAVWPYRTAQLSPNSPLADQHDVGICPLLENGRKHFSKSEEETGEDHNAANQNLQHLVPL